jgi:thymidylate kinase
MSLCTELFTYLNEHCVYAVLRNYNGLPDHYTSRDIDILIEKNTYRKIKSDIIGIANRLGYNALSVFHSNRFDSLIFEENNGTDILQLDYFFNYSVKGIHLVTPGIILSKRIFNGSVYYVSPLFEFMEKYLCNRLLGASYPQKYADIKQCVLQEYGQDLDNWMIDLFGSNFATFNMVENSTVPGLRKAAMRRSLSKGFISEIQFKIEYFYATLCNYLFPQGISISFTGPDGSGKTTVLELLKKEYSKVFAVDVYHFRPNILPRLAFLFHKAGLKKEVDENYSVPHRGKKSSKISSIIRLFYYIFDYIIGYWKIVRPILFRQSVVIFDRYYTDIIVDSHRSNIFLPYKLIAWCRRLVPRMNYNILLTADTDVILSRKQELTGNEIEGINKILQYISGFGDSYKIVLNNEEPEKAVKEIMNYILTKQSQKNISYFQ